MLLVHLLSVLGALPFAGDHAELHPANANLYLEVPDFKAAAAAYEQAPFAKLFRHEKVQKLVAGLTGMEAEAVSLSALVDGGLNLLRDELPVVGVQAIDLLPEVRRVSLSISGVELEGLTGEILASEGEWSPKLDARAGNCRALAILDFDSAQAASRAAELLRSQIESEGAARYAKEELTVAFAGTELQWTYFRARDAQAPFALWFATQEARLILGAGWNTPSDKLFTAASSLASSEGFKDSAQHLPGGAGVPILDCYIRIEGLRELSKLLDAIPSMDPSIPSLFALGMESCHPMGKLERLSRCRLIESRFVTETFDRDFGSSTAPRLHGAQTISCDSFRMVPEDAVGVWVTQLDKEGLHAYLMQALADMTGDEPEKILTTLEDDYGFRPDRDFVDALGGQFAFYTLPFTGIGMPKLHVALELEDHEALARGVEGLGKYLTDVSHGEVQFSSRPYRRSPFFSFTPKKGMGEMIADMDSGGMLSMASAILPDSVSVGVLEDRAIVSLSSMYTKREMKRLLGDEANAPYSALADSQELPAGIRDFGRTDWGSILGGIYESARGIVPLIEQGVGQLPFDIDDLPPSSIFTECFQPTISWSRPVAGGTFEYKESSFGPEVCLGLGALALGVASSSLFSSSSDAMEVAPDESAALENVAEPSDDPVNVTTSRLKELKIAIVVYKGDSGTYPAALTNLQDATANYPNGFLGGAELPNDAWERAFRYNVEQEGASYRLWSLGPDGIDQDGAGDDVTLVRRQN